MELRDLKDSEFLAFLVESQLLSDAGGMRAKAALQSVDAEIETTLLELGLIAEHDLYRSLAQFLQVPLVEAKDIRLELVQELKLKRDFLKHTEAIPVRMLPENGLQVATSNPRATDAVESIGFHSGRRTTLALIAPSALRRVFSDLEGGQEINDTDHASQDQARLRELENDGPIIEMAKNMISDAATQRASDIHIEPDATGGVVRFRVDGQLHRVTSLSRDELKRLTSRFKIMADMNISERRLPQDGRAKVSVLGRDIDLRISTLPARNGESLVARVLDQSAMHLDWGALGFSNDRTKDICDILDRPNGIFLVSGPTGSGKTTTLYTAVQHLQSDTRKIITIEDPVEYALDGVTQIQVQSNIDMTFARALRAILRHDPNIILVGEIRDEETAQIAARAALVGRLVLSTIHTNDSLSAIDRMMDLGVPNFMLANTLRGVLSQRLLPKTCEACDGNGCEVCSNTGTNGRLMVSELMKVKPENAHELAKITNSQELPQHSSIRSFATMQEEAELHVAKGQLRRVDALRLT